MRARWLPGCLVLVGVIVLPVAAKVGAPPLSLQRQMSTQDVQQLVLAPTDVQAELAADARSSVPTPMRFAAAQKVEVTPETHGTWTQLPEGRLWRLRLLSKGATDLNLGFGAFWMPENATLHVLAESEPYFQGPYGAGDNQPHGELWTPVVPGEGAVIEMFVPATATHEPKLVLTQVGTGYRSFFRPQPQVGRNSEGVCNIDVVCPQGSAWSNEVRSVGVYTLRGAWTCSGTLIADVAGDFRNYFLTANHCGIDSGNAHTVVVYWNYQSPTCGTHGPGSLAQNQTGAVFRAAKRDVDFALIELNQMPDPSFRVYYSGWDRSGLAPNGCVGIHHPDCDVKAISFCSTPLTTVNSCIGTGGVDTHWRVSWDSGVTEPGSSGSGIWDPATHRLVGTLSGGGSACASPTSPDCYGKLAVGWDGGTSAAERLRDWLDPTGTGTNSVPGVDPSFVTLLTAAGLSLVSEGCFPTNGGVDPEETVTAGFALKNIGGVATTNLVATLLATGGVSWAGGAQAYGSLIGNGPSVTRSFTFTASGTCGDGITPTLHLQDGPRDLGTVTFSCSLGAVTQEVSFSEDFDAAVAPSLPAGWTGPGWATSTTEADSLPNAAFAPDLGSVSDTRLTSPSLAIDSTNTQLTFDHDFNTEDGYDGGVLEMSVNGGVFNDILSAGGTFLSNGYNQTLSMYYQNPLAGRRAWSGNSGGFITTAVKLPVGAIGQSIRLRWRLGTDNGTGGIGWYVDTISLQRPSYHCCPSLTPPLIVDLRIAGPGAVAFSYDSITGHVYFVETATSLPTTAWATLHTNTGDGLRQSFTNIATGTAQRYFRLRTQ